MKRLRITIIEQSIDIANTWMKEHIDREGGEDTFSKDVLTASGLYTDEQADMIIEQFVNVEEV